MDAMSCLAQPPATFLPTDYYTDAAITTAMHYPMFDHYSPAASTSSPSSSSSLLPADFHYSAGAATASGANWFASAPPPTGITCDSVLVASDAAPRPPSTPATPAATTSNKRRLGLGVAAGAGRAGKRRPRASKRAPTTYISTDPANFRLMVQHVTGIQAEPSTDADVLMPASFNASAAAMLNCPTYTGASFADALQLPSDADAATLHHRLQQQQQPCFPTLDSWNVLYGSAQLF